MKIALVSSEIVPFSKTGGLADVTGALGKYLSLDGLDVRLFTPLYDIAEIDLQNLHAVDFMQDMRVPMGGRELGFSVFTGVLPDSDADVYFIDAPELYHRGQVYTDDADEYLRFALLSRAALECCQRMGWGPDVVHCNDWQTALIPLYLRTLYAWDRLFDRTRTILTIHNLAYQGIFRSDVSRQIGLREEDRYLLHEEDLRLGLFNYLKHGIMYADAISTVSRTYAREIQTPEYGNGLDGMLRTRSDALVGIVNGVDYGDWSPENDRLIAHNYSIDDFEGKRRMKQVLLERLELPYDPDVPVFGIVSRLVEQKGFDLFFDIMDPFLHHVDMRLCVLGSGAKVYEEYFAELQSRYPHRVCFYRGYSNELAHMIEAGSDIFLMPSHYEPCGLNQIYSLRYGTIPVVRRTGGLADTVVQADPQRGEGNGVLFENFNPQGLAWGIDRVLELWRDQAFWRRLMRNAMEANWSWEKQIDHYIELYRTLDSK